MYQLKIGTIPLPKLYVCTTQQEADECKQLGIPYLIKPKLWDDEKLIKAVLWNTLCKKFPYIKWDQVLNCAFNGTYGDRYPDVYIPGEIIKVSSESRINPGDNTEGYSSPDMEITDDDEYRETDGGLSAENKVDFNELEYEKLSLDKYIDQQRFNVSIEELQALKMLPVFLDDIATAIKTNLMNTMYMDGYNKKLECNLGSWNGSDEAPNLIILDVSGSIPSGIAATMISLIETLRHQANADLIITSGRSEYWAANTDLPTPDKLSVLIGGCNECIQFYDILRNRILGKHWGNVIIFGDNDSPLRHDIQNDLVGTGVKNISVNELQSTRIDRIMAFHTKSNKIPGYGLWAKDAAPNAEVVINTSWVDDMRRY